MSWLQISRFHASLRHWYPWHWLRKTDCLCCPWGRISCICAILKSKNDRRGEYDLHFLEWFQQNKNVNCILKYGLIHITVTYVLWFHFTVSYMNGLYAKFKSSANRNGLKYTLRLMEFKYIHNQWLSITSIYFVTGSNIKKKHKMEYECFHQSARINCVSLEQMNQT